MKLILERVKAKKQPKHLVLIFLTYLLENES
jgi:hypothetical protein